VRAYVGVHVWVFVREEPKSQLQSLKLK